MAKIHVNRGLTRTQVCITHVLHMESVTAQIHIQKQSHIALSATSHYPVTLVRYTIALHSNHGSLIRCNLCTCTTCLLRLTSQFIRLVAAKTPLHVIRAFQCLAETALCWGHAICLDTDDTDSNSLEGKESTRTTGTVRHSMEGRRRTECLQVEQQ